MINTMIDLKRIRYTEIKIDQALLDSIRRRGIAIPVHVAHDEDGYVCVDGHKRLTAAGILAQEDSRYARIPVMITNDFTKAGSAFWGNTRNKH